jgi:mono/diheme cytochrome c family protein
MDIPFFNADFVGNRMVIAIMGIVHVWINHAFAVGMVPLIVGIEWWAWRNNRPDWDELARKILFVVFIVTTTFGALTGVGIWLSTTVVNPYAIGSLLRVFFWAWFAEWIVFVSEVGLILAYFLTWKHMTGPRKVTHIRLGVVLAVMSWLTMAIIVAILGFMMNPGGWMESPNLFVGFTNPIYLPQLFFRTVLALAIAGALALGLSTLLTKRGTELQSNAIRVFSAWTLFWLPPTFLAAVVYYDAIPNGMTTNLPVAFGTQAFESQFGLLVQVMLLALAGAAAVLVWGLWRPQLAKPFAWAIPLIVLAAVLGYFERAREFVRKPYVIGYYMLANGIRVDDVPYLLKAGVLPNSVWARHRQVTAENQLEAGEDMYGILCSRCHTRYGLNSVTRKLGAMYPGQDEWSPAAVEAFLKNMHGARPYMPPFVGSPPEREALAAYLASLHPAIPRQRAADAATSNGR